MIDLKGKKGLVLGIEDENSIAYGCAKIFKEAGAELAITHFETPHSQKILDTLKPTITHEYDAQKPIDIGYVFDDICARWGKVDFLLHSIAFAPKSDRITSISECSRKGFLEAMEVSCYSLITLARMCKSLMNKGGSILTLTHYASEKVVEDANIMGPVKAALESIVYYLAAELGDSHAIRVNAISPGAIRSAYSAVQPHLHATMKEFVENSPLHKEISSQDVGNVAAFLVSQLSQNITGTIQYVDAGKHIME